VAHIKTSLRTYFFDNVSIIGFQTITNWHTIIFFVIFFVERAENELLQPAVLHEMVSYRINRNIKRLMVWACTMVDTLPRSVHQRAQRVME